MDGKRAGATTRLRRTRGVGQKRHDPYRSDGKLAGTAFCSGCGASYRRGRWSWGARPDKARATVCPACRRCAEKQPSGVLWIASEVAPNAAELLHLIRNVEQRERALHPLERLMSVAEDGAGVVVETTGVHVARRVADAVARTFHCELETDFLPQQDLVRLRATPRARRGVR